MSHTDHGCHQKKKKKKFYESYFCKSGMRTKVNAYYEENLAGATRPWEILKIETVRFAVFLKRCKVYLTLYAIKLSWKYWMVVNCIDDIPCLAE